MLCVLIFRDLDSFRDFFHGGSILTILPACKCRCQLSSLANLQLACGGEMAWRRERSRRPVLTNGPDFQTAGDAAGPRSA